MISEKEAAKAARVLAEYCENNKYCSYCIFHRGQYCALVDDGYYPENWPEYVEGLRKNGKEENQIL